MKNKLLISIIMVFLSISPCFADAGIPMWVYSNSASFFATGTQSKEGFILFTIITLFLLLIVSFIETFVIKSVLKLSNFAKAFRITLKANIVSTIIGAIITLLLINNDNITSWLWWSNKWFIFNNLMLHIIMLTLSYFVEYNVAKRNLIDYKVNDVKKSFLFANILSYIVFPFLIIGLIIIADYVSDYVSMSQNKLYERINYTTIDNIEVVKPAFIPEPVNKKECKKIRKNLGITAKCDAEVDYWTGAIKACGGIEHLYSQNQVEQIIKEVYNLKPNYVTGDFFNKEIAESYGLPLNFLPLEYLKKHEYSVSEYEEFAKHFPMDAYIWTNKAFNTSNPYVGKFYLRSGHFETRRYNLDEYSKTYAICINNKNIKN